MRPVVALLVVAATLGACRTYENYAPLASQKGLVPADDFARYGAEQAQAVAAGRALAAAYTGGGPEDLTRQTDAAAEYARGLRDVQDVVADPLGHRLTLTFKSGWRTAVVPLDDGTPADATPGLPPRA